MPKLLNPKFIREKMDIPFIINLMERNIYLNSKIKVLISKKICLLILITLLLLF